MYFCQLWTLSEHESKLRKNLKKGSLGHKLNEFCLRFVAKP